MNTKKEEIIGTIIVVLSAIYLGFALIDKAERNEVAIQSISEEEVFLNKNTASVSIYPFYREIAPSIDEFKELYANRWRVPMALSKSVETEFTEEEIEYMERCVEAEAGDQGIIGKCLVVDVILNRVESDQFPNNIIDVINQEGQFAVVSCGSINTVSVTDETRVVVAVELYKRIDHEILYFKTNNYHVYGKQSFSYKDHYFSK